MRARIIILIGVLISAAILFGIFSLIYEPKPVVNVDTAFLMNVSKINSDWDRQKVNASLLTEGYAVVILSIDDKESLDAVLHFLDREFQEMDYSTFGTVKVMGRATPAGLMKMQENAHVTGIEYAYSS